MGWMRLRMVAAVPLMFTSMTSLNSRADTSQMGLL